MPPAAALFATVDPVFASSFVNVFADNGTGSYSTFSHLELSIPFVDSHTAARFDTVSPPPYDFTDLGFAISIDDHQRSANLDAYSLSRGQINFSVDEAAQYVVSGLYQGQNPPGGTPARRRRITRPCERRNLVHDISREIEHLRRDTRDTE